MKIPYSPLLLLLLAIFSCTHRERAVYTCDGTVVTDCLSEISKEIIAIPLETTAQCQIKEIKQVQRSGSDIFLVNGDDICHFTTAGTFLNKITPGNDSLIYSYTIDPENRQLYVLDSLQQLHVYTFDGDKLAQKDLGNSPFWKTLYKIVYHNQTLWAVAENISTDNYYEKWIYKFNLDFQLQDAIQLSTADIGRSCLSGFFTPELSVTDGILYVYTPYSFKETILRDTLHIISGDQLKQNLTTTAINQEKPVYMLPFRMNRRFIIASYQTNIQEKENYLFCFDRKEQKAYHYHGFKDDFYQTGLVNNMQSVDMYTNQLCYYKSGEDVLPSFPERKPTDNPVLFFVTLKS